MIINNGDIFDIGQTVNGVYTFIYLNEKFYYFYDDKIQREYEYDNTELYYAIVFDEDSQFIGNHIVNTREEKLKELGI
jgi:hypothetical protein